MRLDFCFESGLATSGLGHRRRIHASRTSKMEAHYHHTIVKHAQVGKFQLKGLNLDFGSDPAVRSNMQSLGVFLDIRAPQNK